MKVIAFAFIATLLAAENSVAADESPILRKQFWADLEKLLRSTLPKLTKEELRREEVTDTVIEDALDRSLKKITDKYPDRLATTKQEERKLEANEQIVSKAEFVEKVAELRSMETRLPFPVMLEEYEKIETEIGLNPAQRLLAFRLASDMIGQVKKRDEIQKQLKGEQTSGRQPPTRSESK